MSKKITKLCTFCGAPVIRYQSQFYSERIYCNKECARKGWSQIRKGSDNPAWRGGKTTETEKGYILIRQPTHPRSRKNGYVLEHILVAEKMLGRPLLKNERVHHKNHNVADNRPENLKVYSSNGEHLAEEGHYRKSAPPCPCSRPHKGHGLCSRHLSQLRRTGKTWDMKNRYTEPQKAGEPGRHSKQRILYCHCGKKIHARGLCGKHYQRWMKNNKT